MKIKVATILAIAGWLILDFSCRNRSAKTTNVEENKENNISRKFMSMRIEE